jgi:nucleoside 2-deoxyribosyltransferase|tara:strand:- start:2060 stop:2455 length:396 start_codon:yes stop_codon:yes gene_type:complete
MKVYIAGPLFKEDARDVLEKIDSICKELKIDTFLPHRDAGLYEKGDSIEFFNKNKDALDECKIIIAYLDWKGISSGTAWELGYAYAKNIPIIALADDVETVDDFYRICVMCFNSVKIVGSLEELKKELTKI